MTVLQIAVDAAKEVNWFEHHLPIISFVSSIITIISVIMLIAKVWYRQDNRIYNNGKDIAEVNKRIEAIIKDRRDCRELHERSLKEESEQIWKSMEKMVDDRMHQIDSVRQDYQSEYRELLQIIKEDRTTSKQERSEILKELKDFKKDVGSLQTDFTQFRAFLEGKGILK